MPNAIVARAQQIILDPKAAWTEIDAEPADISGIYKSYVAPLAAIPPVAGFIGMSFFGVGAWGQRIHVPIITPLFYAIGFYALTLAAVYVFALVIDWLAPTFGAERNFGQAFKTSAYSWTAIWLAGVFTIIPTLGILSFIAGLYSLYILFLGIPAMMKPPKDKANAYSVASVVCIVVVWIAVGTLLGMVFRTGELLIG